MASSAVGHILAAIRNLSSEDDYQVEDSLRLLTNYAVEGKPLIDESPDYHPISWEGLPLRESIQFRSRSPVDSIGKEVIFNNQYYYLLIYNYIYL